jgi:hypothetical protein
VPWTRTSPTDGTVTVDVTESRCVAELVSDHLAVAADWSVWTPTELPAWSDTPDARRCSWLWTAVGMLMDDVGGWLTAVVARVASTGPPQREGECSAWNSSIMADICAPNSTWVSRMPIVPSGSTKKSVPWPPDQP